MNVIESPNLPEAPGASCANCGAALVADQRYCLACGHPSSPVRLAFLDVLQSERGSHAHSVVELPPTAAYSSARERQGPGGLLERHTGLFGLLSVLLLAGVIGLLVGHWASAGKAPTQSVFKVEGLSGLSGAVAPAATAATATPTTPTTTSKASSTAKGEAGETAAESAKVKAPPPAPKKASTNTLSKLDHLKGKKYQQEVNKLTEGDQPIETGG